MPKAKSYTLPAPIGGINAKDSEEAMEEVYCLDCVNWIPQTYGLELRKGYRVHSTGLGGTVETLVEYPEEDGTRSLIAAANGKLWDATTYNAAATELATGFSEDRWQSVVFKNTLILVNGVDTPQKYDGSSVATATYTGIGTPAKLVSPHAYRNALYFVEKDSASFWYGATGSITGALTEFDVGGYLKKGGYLLFAGSYSSSTAEQESDRFVVVSNMGEVLVYGGSHPSVTWGFLGRYYIPSPLGRRAFFNKDAEMAIITDQGLIPLSKVVGGTGSIDENLVLSYNIQDKFRKDAITYGSNVGWEGFVYPRGNLAIINVPTSSNSKVKQYAMNTLTGGWTEFSGLNALCWTLFNNKPYFGGSDGKVYEFAVGSDDNDMAIPTKLRFAYNYLGDRGNNKRVLQANPRLRGTGDMEFLFGVDVDFVSSPLSDTITNYGTSGTPWGSPWGSPWAAKETDQSGWQQLSGLGRAFALRMEGSFKGVTGSLQAVNITYEIGGYM